MLYLEQSNNNAGIYILVIDLKRDKKIKIGALGSIKFKRGKYCYIGSSQRNLIQRLKRHLKKEKRIHWHIDYFLIYGRIVNIFIAHLSKRYESIIAKEFRKYFSFIEGFGNSDSTDKEDQSHLFFIDKEMSHMNKLLQKFNFKNLRISKLEEVGYNQ